MTFQKDSGCRMKTRLEENENGDTDTNLEVISIVLLRDDCDMTLEYCQWAWREVGGSQ